MNYRKHIIKQFEQNDITVQCARESAIVKERVYGIKLYVL